jgi:hypothetical protein
MLQLAGSLSASHHRSHQNKWLVWLCLNVVDDFIAAATAEQHNAAQTPSNQ